jgi:hypothetical protein
LAFQSLHILADGNRADAEFLGGAGEASRFDCPHESHDSADALHGSALQTFGLYSQ